MINNLSPFIHHQHHFSHLCHRTKYCIAASWEDEASTCSDVHAWLFQFVGACRSPAVTGNRGVHRWRCTASTPLHASEGHTPLWSNSSQSWAYKYKHIKKRAVMNTLVTAFSY